MSTPESEHLAPAAAAAANEQPARGAGPAGDSEQRPPFRIRPIMKQGTAAGVPGTWTRFPTLEEARQAIKAMYHDDRVMRVMIVADDVPPRFIEWVER